MVLYMDRKMKRWELALMCGVLCALALGGWLDREQERLADQVIRLHVIANSDSPEDQARNWRFGTRILATRRSCTGGAAPHGGGGGHPGASA